MLGPPYQQSPGASTTTEPFYSGYTLSAEITAVCFTREKSFLICRDRWLPVHFRMQRCVACSHLFAESDRRTAALQDGALQPDI